jgi:TonB family protein
MSEVSEVLESPEIEQAGGDLKLLIPDVGGREIFLQNLRDLFWPSEPALRQLEQFEATSADFWPDVFVNHRLPWRRFVQSGVYHVLALMAIWEGSQFLTLHHPVIAQPRFSQSDVVYYTPSEYLPPLDTRRPDPAGVRRADPEYSAQPIISLPPESNNRSQTLVSPPNIQLEHDVSLPNVVALLEKVPDPRMPIGPAPAVLASAISRLRPRMERSVIAPPPAMQAVSRESMAVPQPDVVAPPPAVEAGSTRRLGDINIGRSTVIAPAPQLALAEQRSLPGRGSAAVNRQSAQVIAPPPALSKSAGSRSGGSMIALSLHPAIGAPPEPPAGNRRGNFAATPEGHRGASGAPGTSTAGGGPRGSGAEKSGANSLPSGLYVGDPSANSSSIAGNPSAKDSGGYAVNPRLLANARSPRVTGRSMQPQNEGKLSPEESAVFGDRKFYSLSLNMPNLNSAGGSWIIRFAALRPDSTSGGPNSGVTTSNGSSGGPASENLSAPSATRKVDPAYPLELMRHNVGGTVILYGIIHTDGTVGSVRVLRSVDERLDQFAGEAIAKWQFRPATRNGAPVEVEATFWIPFRPTRTSSNF